MDEDAYIRIVRDIEIQKGRMDGHERVCAERYKNLETIICEVKAAVTKSASGAAKWKDKLLYTAVAVLFAFACWAGGQLWGLLPLHH